MKIEDVISHLPDILSNELPGEEVQMKMAPTHRHRSSYSLAENPNHKLGAVLTLLYPKDNVLNTVLMLRPHYDGTHSNQVSFPGGKMENNDLDLSYTAIRETEEEIGVVKTDIRLLGKLTDVYIPPSNFLVKPYVGYIDYTPEFIPQIEEVAAIIETPIETLLDDSIVKLTKVKVASGGKIETPYFDIKNNIVWGATALMLSELKEILRVIKTRT